MPGFLYEGYCFFGGGSVGWYISRGLRLAQAFCFRGVNHIRSPNDQLDKEILSHGSAQALRITRKTGSWLFKRIITKFLAWLLPVITPFLIAFLIFTLIFGFVYFSITMLPKFIAEDTNSPVIFNWGKKDIWTLEEDIELVKEYRKLDYEWISQFRDFYTLAYQRPDTVSGNGADKETVKDVWGSYMAITTSNPLANTAYDEIFEAKAEKYDLDVRLLKALAWAESSFNPNAVSPANCLGIMQLSEAKIKEYGIEDPFDPEQNIDGGARYLRYLLDRFDEDIELAVAAYNAGPNAVDEYDGIPPYPETQNHVKKVMVAYKNQSIAIPSLERGANIIPERQQVERHRVAWALMGALDRVLGDPIIHGKHGPETSGRGRLPDPEKRFKELEPKLEWKDFELYYYHRWTVTYTETDEDGNKVEKTKTYTEKYTHNIKLLTFADTYEAKYYYNWKEKVMEHKDEDSYKKIIVPELEGIEREGPYYKRLTDLLASYGLFKESNTELVLRIAMNMDKEFYLDTNLSSSLIELTGDTEWNYYPGSGELAWPVNGPVTSSFGMRVHPVTGKYRMHTGIDIAVPRGTKIHSAGDGEVIFAGNNGGYGKCIIIDHGKYRTLYGHLLSYNVRPGDKVRKGQVIGRADSTGVSTGDHLHFEVRTGIGKTKFIDPSAVLE